MAKKAAGYLSKELKTTINIKGLYIKPFKSIVLEGLYVQDLEKDTMVYSPRLTVDISEFSLKNRKIAVNTVQMDDGKFYIKQLKDSTTNFEFIINYFDTGKPQVKGARKPYDITFGKIILNKIDFKYKNFNVDTVIRGINFNDIHLQNMSVAISDLDTRNHLAKARIKGLTFREKSGFYLKELTTNATIDTNAMEFRDLFLQTPTTTLRDYFRMDYGRMADVGKFVSKVTMTARFKEATLYTKDIGYFSPALNKMDLRVHLDGNVRGKVGDLRATNLAVRAGNATYLKGNFRVKGLPDVYKTYMDLNFAQLSTNKKDIDNLLSRITGNNKTQLPPMLSKLGTINYKGSLEGLQNDFTAKGEFKTALGRVQTDANMKFLKDGTPVYSGIVRTYDFNLGELLDQKSIGRTTVVANVKGRGFALKGIQTTVKGDLTYFDFNGYRYSNLNVNGTLANQVFDGKLNINDRNIKLDFLGKVNLDPNTPQYDFRANIRGANLHKLNLIKDTVQIDADFSANITGTNLDNLQGNALLNKVRLTNTETSLVVDSVYLTASGLGDERSLTINSDIVDASITGKYDLSTLPSYFKSVAKKYIPSMKVNIVKYAEQNFKFRLNLKYFEPISILFMPELKIPEPAVFNGEFISSQNVATLNGSAPLIQYGNIKINDFILDESTTETSMNIFLSSERIDITDSLYVKNVNIANILRNDSLNLNIKLSDLDATNQLDLNGLVEFNTEDFARLSILPSDVIINREEWRIQEQVKLKFDKGKTIIENFELFRDNQLAIVNGVISSDPEDRVEVSFNNFKLTTFNPITQTAGVNLRGTLNGDVTVMGALSKTPKLEAGMKIDSMVFNNTPIGQLNLDADLDNGSKLVNVKMNILNGLKETLNVTGTYNANSESNNLNMQVKMDDSEIIIFEPFLKKLVSNLKGKVSADLRVTGQITNPRINGMLTLNEGGMTVNYLKTPYTISDQFEVENSVIKLDGLAIKDINGNEAIADGTVDMRNPNNPDIDITLVANNFMALNTTAKDNQLYYGTAYATGLFTFKGPTDNMRIDINASTEAGTVFTIPLNSASTVSANDFITFVAKDSLLTPKQETNFKGLTMNFELQVDENSTVNIITDVGKLMGKGRGDLNLNITSLGDFEMFGDYLLSTGKFEFTAQDFINKIFELSPGGSIRWTGNPQEAKINIRALYAVRTSLAPLYTAAGRTTNDAGVVNAEAVMNLSGDLLKPDISFDVNFPANAAIKDELQSYFNDPSNVSQQALSLIVRRSFAPGTNSSITDQVNSTLVSAGTELVFNQLNNILAQTLNLTFVDFNIRSLSDASASLRFFNGRLVVSGGVTDRRNIAGDFNFISGNAIDHDMEIMYLIRKDGSLYTRFSNRRDNRNLLTPTADYINTVGLVYRKDFDNFDELLSFMVGKKRKEDRSQQPIPNPTPPITKPVTPIVTDPQRKGNKK